MTTWICSVVVGAVVVLTPSAVNAQGAIYRWIDAKGTVSFGQTPPGNRQSHTLTRFPAPAPPPGGASQLGETNGHDVLQSSLLPPSLDVTGEPLRGQNLAGRDWDDALLNRTVLNGANLNGASFQGASLIEAVLSSC